jgi:hypothetical protein
MQNGLSWQSQYQLVQSLTSDPDATNLALVKTLLAQGQRTVESVLNIDYTTTTRTFTTYTDAISGTSYQAYAMPENFYRMVHLYVTVGSVRYSGEQIFDEKLWQEINQTTGVTSNFLQLFYIRGNTRIELYPIPSSACTATMIYQPVSKPLSADDYTTGTITTLTNGASAVTASGSTFTAAMVGRYFKVNSDGYWYKISAFGTTTTLTLDSEYQGTSIAAGTENYTIGEFPITPADTHILPVYFACWKYSLFRKDVQMAREYERQWKEGLNDAQNNYASNSASHIIDSRPQGFRGGINPNFFPSGMT